ETERPLTRYRDDARRAYDSALELQTALYQEAPGNPTYQQELARTHYNRGILLSDSGDLNDSDFREAIRILEPLSQSAAATPQVHQELARSFNNLGRLLRRTGKTAEAQDFYRRAIAIHESLAKSAPENRDFKLELATFYNNLAIL